MIVRTRKNKNYSSINNTVLRDERLSWRARGIAAYLLTMPDDWEINHDHLWKHGIEGRDAVLNAMRELEEVGYLVRTKTQDKRGKFQTTVTLHEEPQPTTENPPIPENQVSVNQNSVDQVSVNQDSRINTKDQVLKTNKNTSYSSASPCEAPHPTPHQEMFGAVCDAIGSDPNTLTKEDKGQIAQVVGILTKAGYTVDDLRRFMTDVWFNDWRWKKEGQHPSLKQLRQEIGKIRSVLPSVAPPPPKKQTGLDRFKEVARRQGTVI